jgi:proteasome activator subunit 4
VTQGDTSLYGNFALVWQSRLISTADPHSTVSGPLADYVLLLINQVTRRLQLLRACINCAGRHFDAWVDEFSEILFASIASPYEEVRGNIALILQKFAAAKFHPCFPSTSALLKAIADDPDDRDDLMGLRSGHLLPQIKGFMESLPILKEQRPHGPQAALSEHDTSAETGQCCVQKR